MPQASLLWAECLPAWLPWVGWLWERLLLAASHWDFWPLGDGLQDCFL
jgi:hypothetical protein